MTITEPNDTSAVGKTKTKRSPIGTAMRVLTAVTGSDFARKYGLADPINRAAYQGTKTGFRTLGAANRAFAKATGDGKPKRPTTSSKGLFNLTPDDEQQMIADTVKEFATEILRPAAYEADAKAEAPVEILERSAELGITMINVPEEYDGAAAERGVVTNALVAEVDASRSRDTNLSSALRVYALRHAQAASGGTPGPVVHPPDDTRPDN